MPKVKPSRAKRTKKKIAEQVTKRPIPEEPTYHNITRPTDEEVARMDAVLEARIAESDREAEREVDHMPIYDEQPRFEDYEYFGEPAIIDHHTGFIARFGHREARDAMIEAANRTHDDPTFIDGLDWTHLPSGARVYLTHYTESNRFFVLDHPDVGVAILDRFTQMIVPMHENISAEEIDELMATINEHIDSALGLFSSDGVSIDEWMRVGGGIDVAEDPTNPHWEDEVEVKSLDTEAVMASAPAGRPLRVLVISSSSWAWGGLVDQHVGSLVARSGDQNRPVVIITSGSPNGAEAGARALADAHGWYVETIRDEGIPHGDIDYGFAYISNQSAGAEAALEVALAARIPVHITRETSAVIPDAWAGR